MYEIEIGRLSYEGLKRRVIFYQNLGYQLKDQYFFNDFLSNTKRKGVFRQMMFKRDSDPSINILVKDYEFGDADKGALLYKINKRYNNGWLRYGEIIERGNKSSYKFTQVMFCEYEVQPKIHIDSDLIVKSIKEAEAKARL